jgi:Ca2+-binding EF-hand superfamily protein
MTSVLSVDKAILRLCEFNAHTREPSKEDEDVAEEMAFQKMQEEQRKAEELRCPSLTVIPRFYEPKSSPVDEITSLRPRVLREARQLLWHRKSNECLFDEEDLHRILALLKEHARTAQSEGNSGSVEGSRSVNSSDVIDYAGFMQLREELVRKGERFKSLFTAATFLKFPRDKNGCINIAHFVAFVVRKARRVETRMQLSYYDVLGRGYLREKDMENFVFELIPTLPQLSSLREEFYPFYVFTAVRKFFFFLDPKRTGRIHIKDLLSSNLLSELYELRQNNMDASDIAGNWFSTQSALKVYGAYLELDVDQNGMLSKTELGRYGQGMLTDVIIERVFDEYQTYKDSETGEREMDYKTFLDFVLAMENRSTRQALQYFWKLIDIRHQGFIDGFVINYFFGAIVKMLQVQKFDVASVDDVKDEIFDMVKASTSGIITLQDLINCRQGGVVLSMLIDAAAFWRYDNRENLMMDPEEDDIDGI